VLYHCGARLNECILISAPKTTQMTTSRHAKRGGGGGGERALSQRDTISSHEIKSVQTKIRRSWETNRIHFMCS
jgi:hypothetical protein